MNADSFDSNVWCVLPRSKQMSETFVWQLFWMRFNAHKYIFTFKWYNVEQDTSMLYVYACACFEKKIKKCLHFKFTLCCEHCADSVNFHCFTFFILFCRWDFNARMVSCYAMSFWWLYLSFSIYSMTFQCVPFCLCKKKNHYRYILGQHETDLNGWTESAFINDMVWMRMNCNITHQIIIYLCAESYRLTLWCTNQKIQRPVSHFSVWLGWVFLNNRMFKFLSAWLRVVKKRAVQHAILFPCIK